MIPYCPLYFPCSFSLCTFFAELQKLLQSDQFCIEIRDAMRQIIGGSHTREQSETGNLQQICKHWHTRHRQDIVHAQRTQEGTLSRHVGSGDDIIVVVLDGEIVLHRLGTQERMIEILTLNTISGLPIPVFSETSLSASASCFPETNSASSASG